MLWYAVIGLIKNKIMHALELAIYSKYINNIDIESKFHDLQWYCIQGYFHPVLFEPCFWLLKTVLPYPEFTKTKILVIIETALEEFAQS